MTKKYEIFFKGLIDFSISKNLSSRTSFIGLTENEISILQEKLGVIFPLTLKMYLKFIGGKFEINRCSIPNATRSSIEKAERQAIEKGIRQKMKHLKVVSEWDHKEIEESIEQICFINWEDQNDYFSFVRLNDDTCNIYGWDYDNVIYKWEGNLISEIRRQILFGLMRISNQNDLDAFKLNHLPKGFLIDQIINDRKMVENVRAYDMDVIKSEKENETFITIETYLDNYIIERRKSSI